MRICDADVLVLRVPQKLSCDGIVTCVVTVASRTHKALEIDISGRGISFADDSELLGGAQDVVRSTVDRSAEKAGNNVDATRKAVRNALSNYLWSKTKTRPLIIPVVMEV